MQYHAVPVGVLESTAELDIWARKAIAAARGTSHVARRTARRTWHVARGTSHVARRTSL
jgi:DNA-binding phage protein